MSSRTFYGTSSGPGRWSIFHMHLCRSQSKNRLNVRTACHKRLLAVVGQGVEILFPEIKRTNEIGMKMKHTYKHANPQHNLIEGMTGDGCGYRGEGQRKRKLAD